MNKPGPILLSVKAKGDRPLKWNAADDDLPWPTDFEYQRHVGFTSRGEMFVRDDTGLNEVIWKALQLAIDDQLDGPINRATILNLNHPALVAARQAAIDSERTRIEREFEERTATKEDREHRARRLVAANPLAPFVSVRVCWLRRNIGRGR